MLVCRESPPHPPSSLPLLSGPLVTDNYAPMVSHILMDALLNPKYLHLPRMVLFFEKIDESQARHMQLFYDLFSGGVTNIDQVLPLPLRVLSPTLCRWRDGVSREFSGEMVQLPSVNSMPSNCAELLRNLLGIIFRFSIPLTAPTLILLLRSQLSRSSRLSRDNTLPSVVISLTSSLSLNSTLLSNHSVTNIPILLELFCILEGTVVLAAHLLMKTCCCIY
jgi:hypothetical protein